nr:hypothetical protein [Tanacetum cinerariifolium]
MVPELRLRYEHEIMIREKFEKKFTDSVVVIQQRDAEIVDLNTRLEKFEAEGAKVIDLRKRVSDLEATVAVKVGELANLRTENVGLVEKVFALESERAGLQNQVVSEGKMREEFALQHDAAEWCFTERAFELDARIADVRRDMDNALYPHMLTAIAGRRWVIGHSLYLAVYKCARFVECQSAMGKVILTAINKGIQQGLEADIVHGNAGRSLAQLEAYDLEVEGRYVAAVSEFKNISFPLLDELESLKDSLLPQSVPLSWMLALPTEPQRFPLASIMSALVLKDDQGNVDAAPEFARYQPSLDQVVVPVYSDSGSVDREMLLSEAIPSLTAFFGVACLVAAVDKISWTKTFAADFRVVVSFHPGLAFGFSDRYFLPSFLEEVQAAVCPFHLAVGLWVFNGCKPLPDIKLLTPVFERIVPELLFVVRYNFSWKPTHDVILYKFLDLVACYYYHGLRFDPLCEVVDCYYQKFHFSSCLWKRA